MHILGIALGLTFPAMATGDDFFQGLGFPTGQAQISGADGISPNGEWVIGTWYGAGGEYSAYQGFVWSESTGFLLRPEEFGSGFFGVGNEGKAIGTAWIRFGKYALAWNAPAGQGFYAPPDPLDILSTGVDIAASGSRILVTIGGDYWLLLNGPALQIQPPPGATIGLGAIDAEGQRACGRVSRPGVPDRALVWDATTGFNEPVPLPGWGTNILSDISLDGTVAVGYGVNPSGKQQPLIWRQPWGLRQIAILAGTQGSRAFAVSADGRVIVGRSTEPELAFVWDRVRGTRNLKTYLAQLGSADVTGWTLRSATGISADGRIIVGWGTDPEGRPQAWKAVIPAYCYANCDISLAPPVLNVADFACFLQRFANGDPYANCDESTVQPVLNVADFACFLQAFAAGCH